MVTSRKSFRLLLPSAAVLVLALDQITKYVVQRYLAYQAPWNPIEPLARYVSLTYVTNTGAVFGLFPEGGWAFTIFTLVVIGGIILYQRHIPPDSWLLHLSLGLQLGGALGNLVDRLLYGHVIDFVDFKFWPVFNVADSAISIGAVCLAYYLFAVGRDEENKLQQDEMQV